MTEERNNIDLPSLTSFTGSGNNFMYFGSVIIESNAHLGLQSRHIITIIQHHSIIELLLHVLGSGNQLAITAFITIKTPMDYKITSASNNRIHHRVL